MKKIILSLTIILNIVVKISFGNNTITAKNTLENYLLCKTWGALKYFHPAVKNSKVNADSIFFDAYNQLKNNRDINFVIDRMCGKFGAFENKKQISSNIIPAWILEDTILNRLNKDKLILLFSTYNGEKNFYYFDKKSTKPNFIHEVNYYNQGTYPSESLRLLGLARLFNIYYYFYPYKNQINKPLDSLLMKYIPYVISAKDDISFSVAIFKFLSHIKDSHGIVFSSTFLNKWHWKGFYPSFHVIKRDSAFIIQHILSDSLINNNIIDIGDTIVKINNVDIFKVYNHLDSLFGNSNETSQIFKICTYYLLNGEFESDVLITLKKNGKYKNITFKRDIGFGKEYFKNLSRKPYKVINDTIYINARAYSDTLFNDNTFKHAFYNSNVLLFDMRGYPSSDDVFHLMSLLTKKKVVAAKFKWANNKNLLKIKNSEYIINPALFKKKAAFKQYIGIIDVTAISAMETLAMCFKAVGGKLIGSPTIAGNGNLRGIYIPGQIYITMSILSVYFPDGTCLLPQGVVPDEIIDSDQIKKFDFY